jgi:hypothetical protein
VKGEAIHSIIGGLKGGKLLEFKNLVAAMPHGAELTDICNYLLENATYSSRALMLALGLSKHAKNKAFELLEGLLLFHQGNNDGEQTLKATVALAQNLVMGRHYESAIELIENTIKDAEAVENYEVIIDMWLVYDEVSDKRPVVGMDLSLATTMLDNLADYQRLMRRYQIASRETDTKVMHADLRSICQDPILASFEWPRSKRALYLFLKVKSACLIRLMDQVTAIPLQEALVQLVQACSWVCLNPEYVLVKESVVLAVLYLKTDQTLKYEAIKREIEMLPASSMRAKEEKLFHEFPWLITVSIDKGDVAAGSIACQKLLMMIAGQDARLTPRFIVENLFCCTYFLIACGNHTAAANALIHTRTIPKADFPPNYFALIKLLEIILAIELQDWADARRQIKNLSATKQAEDLMGYKGLLLFLDRGARNAIESSLAAPSGILVSSDKKLDAALQGQLLGHYFDVHLWLQARRESRPMIELFHHRALSATSLVDYK